MSIIEVRHLCKEFKVRRRHHSALKTFFDRHYDLCRAVDDLNFSIEEGEAVGFIGPNGAGKSTTIKMMTGILQPTAGTVSVMGKDPCRNRKENARHIGAVFGQRSQLWWDLPVRDSFELLARIYDVTEAQYAERTEMFCDVLKLADFWQKPVRQLSLGQKMRAEFAAALLHDPKILFLDEPTIGLDVVVKQEIRTLICEIQKKRHTTVLLTTHDMRDIEEICQRLIMIDHGRLMLDDTVDAIRETLGSRQSMRLTFASPIDDLHVADCRTRRIADAVFEIDFDHRQCAPNQLLMQIAQQHTVVDMSLIEPDIEEIIRNLYLKNT